MTPAPTAPAARAARHEEQPAGPVIQVEHLATRFGSRVVHSDISFEVQRAEVFALSSALADIATVTRTVATRSGTLDSGIVHGVRALEQASLAVGELRPVIAQVGRSAQALEVMGRDTALASARAASAVADAGQSVQSLGTDTAPELQRLLGELQGLTLSLRRFSDAAERSPTSLLFGRAALPPGPGEPAIRPLSVEPARAAATP